MTTDRKQRTTDNGQRTTDKRDSGQRTKDKGQRTPRATARGFTMIELLVVIIIVAILIGLLLPAINGAIRTARNAAVSAEISQLSQALENFKNRYGAYPPSRVILFENGVFPVGNTTLIPGENTTVGALATQTLAALRQFFPKVSLSTSALPALVLAGNGSYWYDFNGNGVFDQGAYILHGHECLVFFLGGVPLLDIKSNTYGLTGFGQDPTNPFTNSVNNGNNMYNGNRQPPIFEFNAGRLFLDPNNVANTASGLLPAGIPGYYDSFNNNPPGQGTTLNYYAYFSAYGNGAYNPDDVNFFLEDDGGNNSTQAPLAPVWLGFQNGPLQISFSPVPNPYTSSATANNPPGNLVSATVTFQKAQTYQIISSGQDGQYGVGGQYVPATAATSTAASALPFDPANTGAGPGPPPAQAETGPVIRLRENDNLTNFKSGTLQ